MHDLRINLQPLQVYPFDISNPPTVTLILSTQHPPQQPNVSLVKKIFYISCIILIITCLLPITALFFLITCVFHPFVSLKETWLGKCISKIRSLHNKAFPHHIPQRKTEVYVIGF